MYDKEVEPWDFKLARIELVLAALLLALAEESTWLLWDKEGVLLSALGRTTAGVKGWLTWFNDTTTEESGWLIDVFGGVFEVGKGIGVGKGSILSLFRAIAFVEEPVTVFLFIGTTVLV